MMAIYYVKCEYLYQQYKIHFIIILGITTLVLYRHKITVNQSKSLLPWKQDNKLTLIALGDSLTEGMVRRADYKDNDVMHPKPRKKWYRSVHDRPDLFLHPYTLHLSELIKSKYPGKKVDIVNKGISGERLLKMDERLLNIVTEYKEIKLSRKVNSDEGKYNFVIIILGGTNDFIDMIRASFELSNEEEKLKFFEKQSDVIYANIIKMHNLCQHNNIESVVVTLPPILNELTDVGGEIYQKYRKTINQKLKEYVLKNNKQKNIIYADFAEFLENNNKLKDLFSDSVHFTQQGYNEMGEFILKIIEKYFKLF